jgi:hypothetical protein
VGYGEGSDETGYCCQKLQKLVGGTRSKTYFRVFNLKWKLFGNSGTMCSGKRGVRIENAETSARWRGISGEKAGGGLREQVERLSGEYSTASSTCEFTSSYVTVAEGRTRAERRFHVICVCSDITHPYMDNFRYICDLVRLVPVRIGKLSDCRRVANRSVRCDWLSSTRNP